jgi:hypothetical protein
MGSIGASKTLSTAGQAAILAGMGSFVSDDGFVWQSPPDFRPDRIEAESRLIHG